MYCFKDLSLGFAQRWRTLIQRGYFSYNTIDGAYMLSSSDLFYLKPIIAFHNGSIVVICQITVSIVLFGSFLQ